jgi:hypothetical protein
VADLSGISVVIESSHRGNGWLEIRARKVVGNKLYIRLVYWRPQRGAILSYIGWAINAVLWAQYQDEDPL